MATPRFSFVVTVVGGAGAVELPVVVAEPSLELDGLTPKAIPFSITNTLSTMVEFTTVTIDKAGAHAAKVLATVLSDAFQIAPGASFANTLTVTPLEALPTSVEVVLTVSGIGTEA